MDFSMAFEFFVKDLYMESNQIKGKKIQKDAHREFLDRLNVLLLSTRYIVAGQKVFFFVEEACRILCRQRRSTLEDTKSFNINSLHLYCVLSVTQSLYNGLVFYIEWYGRNYSNIHKKEHSLWLMLLTRYSLRAGRDSSLGYVLCIRQVVWVEDSNAFSHPWASSFVRSLILMVALKLPGRSKGSCEHIMCSYPSGKGSRLER